MNDIADRLEALIPQGDGYNSEYAHTLVEAVEALRKAKLLSAEPVAWAATSDEGAVEALGFNESRRFDTPLYAHPPTDSAALRDAERLDWLEHMAGDPGGLLLHDGSVKPPRLGLGLRPGSTRRTLREAIDAAMAQHGEQSDG